MAEVDHHAAEERYFVLTGEIVDNDQRYRAGTHVVFAPGSSHRPIEQRVYVNGAWVSPSSHATIEVRNSATEQVAAEVARGTAEDVDLAVRAAHEALPEWRATPPTERQRWLRAIATEIRDAADDIASLLVAELGTVRAENLVHVTRPGDIR